MSDGGYWVIEECVNDCTEYKYLMMYLGEVRGYSKDISDATIFPYRAGAVAKILELNLEAVAKPRFTEHRKYDY